MSKNNNAEVYHQLYGYWAVTTEGDCEGRTTRNLGTFKGWLDEIALHLADKNHYSLHFKKVEMVDNYLPKAKKVSVTLDIDSETWNMTPDQRAAYVQRIFDANNRDVKIVTGQYHASFVLHADVEDITDKRTKALAKLTDEERKILGV
jgi:hypothetical protein